MRILVIDDNLTDQYLIREAAETLSAPPQRTFAMDGEHGLALLTHYAQGRGDLPQLILLDIQMPGLSGLEVLERLKGHDRLALIPVVMLTTSNLPGDIEQARRLRASDYILKDPDYFAFREQFHGLITSWRLTLSPLT